MSDQPEDQPLNLIAPPPTARPGYPVDESHDVLFLELVEPGGSVVASVPFAPPVNKNSAAPYVVQVRIMHPDGCWRVLQRDPLATY